MLLLDTIMLFKAYIQQVIYDQNKCITNNNP